MVHYHMNKFLVATLLIVIILGSFTAGWLVKEKDALLHKDVLSETNDSTQKDQPLLKYTTENMSKTPVPLGEYSTNSVEKGGKDFETTVVSLELSPDFDAQNMKKVSALLNVPKEEGKYPLILMLRGYVDSSIYYSGVGTAHSGEFFAQNGFITLAPDFLGYAASDENAADIFESRFQTYTTARAFLDSVDTAPFKKVTKNKWDGKNIFIWAHSNGGQIALTLLEITGKDIPTVLWAPVSKPFPYSVLYYTDESVDNGKFIRAELSKFESDYDVEKFSLTNYLDTIHTSLQVYQGGSDDAVPLDWSKELVNALQSNEVDATLFVYPQADHDMRPNWDEAVQSNLEFYQSHIK